VRWGEAPELPKPDSRVKDVFQTHRTQGLCAGRAVDPGCKTIQRCGRNLQWAITLENAGPNGSADVERSARCSFGSTGALRKLSGRAGARLRQAYGAAGPRPTSSLEAPYRLTELIDGAADTACAMLPG
jgi:hypothetical protein